MRALRVLSAAFVAATLLTGAAHAQDALPSFNVDKTQTSVSGLSSGAFITVQFHTAYSADIMGAGIVAGGPYNCAFVNWGGIMTCMQGAPIGGASYSAAQGYAALGQIDDTSNLARSRLYIYSGTKDSVVAQSVVDATYSYYQAVGVPKSQIKYVKSVPSGHALITPAYGSNCGTNASPYINHCTVDKQGYDQAGAILTQIYGTLNKPSAKATGRIASFSQKSFGDYMGDTGYLYVPQACDQGATCRIHVAFHGCVQTPSDVGDQYYTDTGYNQWADTNNFLVLYPQAPVNVATNPQHCWDWWGYSGMNFNVKSAPQMSAVKTMIDRLAK